MLSKDVNYETSPCIRNILTSYSLSILTIFNSHIMNNKYVGNVFDLHHHANFTVPMFFACVNGNMIN